MDNGCNLHSFALGREPSHFRDICMRVLGDEPHYRGHTDCSQGYNTGETPSCAWYASLRTKRRIKKRQVEHGS